MTQPDAVIKTAKELKKLFDYFNRSFFFRCKIWGGGTAPEKYVAGIGDKGIKIMREIQKSIPVGTEVRTPEQIELCKDFNFLWIGARNCYNYDLLKIFENYKGAKFIKRNYSMNVIGLYNLYRMYPGINYVERGISTINGRYGIDIDGLIRIKNNHKKLFSKINVDCSHASDRTEYIADTYQAAKAIGIESFWFEVGESETDKEHELTIEQFSKIIGEQK